MNNEENNNYNEENINYNEENINYNEENINYSEENINYENEKEVEKNSKSNEEILKEKVDNIMKNLDDVEANDIKRNKIKTFFFIIAIIIEIIIIILIINRKTKTEYKMTLKCTNNDNQLYENYTTRFTNVYYFNDKDKVAKIENEELYSFDNKYSYEEYIKEHKIKNNTNFKGYSIQSTKDDNKYIYKVVTTYTFDELKKNHDVKFKNNTFSFIEPNGESKSIMIQGYDDVIESNEIMNFKCE